MISRKTIFESHEFSYGALTALIKIHRCELWWDILFAHTNMFSIWLFHRKFKLSILSNIFYVRTKIRKKISCPFSSPKKPKRQKSSGTSKFMVEQDLWLLIWVTVGRKLFWTKKNGWRNSRTQVPPMKMKIKIQQVLFARNCWRMDAFPKLPQWEIESSTDVDVDDIDLQISSF